MLFFNTRGAALHCFKMYVQLLLLLSKHCFESNKVFSWNQKIFLIIRKSFQAIFKKMVTVYCENKQEQAHLLECEQLHRDQNYSIFVRLFFVMQFFQIHGALTSDLIQERHIDWLYAAIVSQSEKQKRINLVKKVFLKQCATETQVQFLFRYWTRNFFFQN